MLNLTKTSAKHFIITIFQGTVLGAPLDKAEVALNNYLDSFKANHGSTGGQEFMMDYLNSEEGSETDYLDTFLVNLNREKQINGLLKDASRLKNMSRQ